MFHGLTELLLFRDGQLGGLEIESHDLAGLFRLVLLYEFIEE